ncbi:ABC transporter substrate binding protein [Evansella sp. AB-P1]|uniref:ABC transporter substrate-binding protein n=1 Tax=Evansella sp. AB-P1 TaxID=3037653 RepID=UPI00241D10E4|nr:ABC transporter substrate binding protein [Evansella sp. AB-P1]MDG5790102.1 ABC transporter substrate binding protein [Evansella sp. AB-P1]
MNIRILFMKREALIILILLLTSIMLGCFNNSEAENEFDKTDVDENESGNINVQDQTFKVFHVMSYHTPWEWTETQLQGFQDALGDDIQVEYEIFEMDTKNFSTEEEKKAKGDEAIALIEASDPDLLFVSDDDAVEFVALHFVNTSLPIVFSAVNEEPEFYGFENASNVTGVLEVEHFIENVNLLKDLVPDVDTIAVIFDDDPMWGIVRERMEERIPSIDDVSFVSWDYFSSFKEYQDHILHLQTEVDAIALIGIFTFKDENGQNVHYRDVLEWTAANSQLPDFSFWKDRATFGTLSVVSISGYEQGREAGLLARSILVDGKSPSDLPITTSMKGEPLISKARADDLGIQIKSQTLLSSRVVTEYGWMIPDE